MLLLSRSFRAEIDARTRRQVGAIISRHTVFRTDFLLRRGDCGQRGKAFGRRKDMVALVSNFLRQRFK